MVKSVTENALHVLQHSAFQKFLEKINQRRVKLYCTFLFSRIFRTRDFFDWEHQSKEHLQSSLILVPYI